MEVGGQGCAWARWWASKEGGRNHLRPPPETIELQGPIRFIMAQLSEAIAKMAATLEERASYIDTFASNVAHEFKTPLTSIRGTVELLRDHLEAERELLENQRQLTVTQKQVDAFRVQLERGGQVQADGDVSAEA